MVDLAVDQVADLALVALEFTMVQLVDQVLVEVRPLHPLDQPKLLLELVRLNIQVLLIFSVQVVSQQWVLCLLGFFKCFYVEETA